MKKTYKEPKMMVVKIETVHMVAGSELDAGGETNQNLSRRGHLWDDEDEDEEYEDY